MNLSTRQQITLALRTGIANNRNVDLEHGHVYIVKHHNHKLTAKRVRVIQI